jgi:hypothetical protein
VANAIGVRVNSLPITPDKVLEALDKNLGRGTSIAPEESFVAVENVSSVAGDFTDDIPA